MQEDLGAVYKKDPMPEREKAKRWNRRQFVAGVATVAASGIVRGQGTGRTTVAPQPREMFIVSNFHPASCGWLTTFSKERVYCANSYLSHLDRVRDDAQYEFVLSEVNNVVAIMNFRPERIAELKQRVAEGRVELVNAFFLESTINLSGGEALVRMGVDGMRWYESIFGVRPRYAWCIDTCGVHDQMPQIAHGLGLDALVYTRENPTGKTIYWTEAPDGSRVLTLSPGSYGDASSIFTTRTMLTDVELQTLERQFASKEKMTPEGAPLMLIASSGDYSVAPPVKAYPTELLEQWKNTGNKRKLRFATLSTYVDTIMPGVVSGAIRIPTHQGGTAYTYDSFWIENPKVKTWYRKSEHGLQAAEALATIANLRGSYEYPSQELHEAWTLMFLNTDRNTLWGSAGGMVFVDDVSWDVQDRFEWVTKVVSDIQGDAAKSMVGAKQGVVLFNPLNWQRSDPVVLRLPEGKSIDGVACEALSNGDMLCRPTMESMSLTPLRLVSRAPRRAKSLQANGVIETSHYLLTMDAKTGAIASLKIKSDGRELFGGAANVVIAERPKSRPDDPGDHMPPIPERERLATSNQGQSTIAVSRGPLTTTIVATGKFFGGGEIRRTIRMYEEHPRIDLETELNDVPNYTVVFADFPLAADVSEVRRGIPFGFSHAAWAVPNPNLHGWAKGIVPAVRWSSYDTVGGGVAILDRGLSGRELNGRTASIYLFNAEDKYWGYENPWLTGKGKHILQFALLPYSVPWKEAQIPHAGWEYNMSPLQVDAAADTRAHSYLETSDNLIVESLRREGDHMVLRLVEALGSAGEAYVKLMLPHSGAVATDLTGRRASPLSAGPEYRFAVRPQQIMTIHFHTASAVADTVPVTAWDKFVPQQKLAALHRYDPKLIGHPPFGA
jgi:alpha-mannosidase